MDSARTLPFASPVRQPGLDALRAYATVLVVVLHAAVPYSVAPMPSLTWPVRHPEPSAAVDVVFWGIEGLIMPLFLLLSGYGAAISLANKPGEFLSSRWRRLGWPLIGVACVLLPIELYIWLVGWALDGQIPWTKLRSLKLGPYHENLWGLSHLWYLEYLLIYSALLWAGDRCLLSRWKRLLGALFSQRIVLLACGASILWFALEVVVGFQHGFLPFPAKFAYSGMFFASGVALASDAPRGRLAAASTAVAPVPSPPSRGRGLGRGGEHFKALSSVARRWGKRFLASIESVIHRPPHPNPLPHGREGTKPKKVCAHLTICGLLLLCLLPLIHRQASQPLFGRERAILAIGLAAYAVLATRAIWEWAWSFRGSISPPVKRLARASFWIYLVHHPLVAIGHIALRPTGWTALTQCLLVTLATLAIALVTYERLVCGSWLGAFLEGRFRKSAAGPTYQPDPSSAEPWIDKRAA